MDGPHRQPSAADPRELAAALKLAQGEPRPGGLASFLPPQEIRRLADLCWEAGEKRAAAVLHTRARGLEHQRESRRTDWEPGEVVGTCSHCGQPQVALGPAARCGQGFLLHPVGPIVTCGCTVPIEDYAA